MKIKGLGIKELNRHDANITEFEESAWTGVIKYVEVGRRKEMKFVFHDGTSVTV